MLRGAVTCPASDSHGVQGGRRHVLGGVGCGVDSPREITASAASNPGRSRGLSVSYRNSVGICFLIGPPDKREVGSSTLPRPTDVNSLPRLAISRRAGLPHGPKWGGCVDSLCRLLPAEGLQRLPSLEPNYGGEAPVGCMRGLGSEAARWTQSDHQGSLALTYSRPTQERAEARPSVGVKSGGPHAYLRISLSRLPSCVRSRRATCPAWR